MSKDTVAGRSRLTEALCAVEGCEQPRRKRGWCASHYQQQRRSGRPPEPFQYKWATERVCVVCGASTTGKKLRRYCSNSCSVLGSTYGRHRPVTIDCARCGATIDLRSRNEDGRLKRIDTRLCTTCKRTKHPISVKFLLERDGHGCGICGEPIDMTTRKPDLRCASVDHVVARAHGGSDDPANLQLAHLRCNQIKQARVDFVWPNSAVA